MSVCIFVSLGQSVDVEVGHFVGQLVVSNRVSALSCCPLHCCRY